MTANQNGRVSASTGIASPLVLHEGSTEATAVCDLQRFEGRRAEYGIGQAEEQPCGRGCVVQQDCSASQASRQGPADARQDFFTSAM